MFAFPEKVRFLTNWGDGVVAGDLDEKYDDMWAVDYQSSIVFVSPEADDNGVHLMM